MATAQVADLVTTLRADSAKFDKDIENTKKRLRGYADDAKKSTKQNESLSQSFKNASGSAAQLPGPLGNIGGKLDGMIGTVSGLGVAWTALGGGVAVAIGAMAKGLPTLAETERRMLQQEQLIKATGYSSGYTATQLDELARSVAMATLTSTQEASKAIGVMLTFRSVMNDNNNAFERSIYLAQDMASVMGGDITSAAKQLGKALEMPSTGMSALRESGISFTKSQIDMVKAMEESGRVAEAQSFILDELDNQIGGAAGAEAGGLIGSVDTLGQVTEEAFEAFAKWSQVPKIVNFLTDELSEAATVIRDFFDPTTKDEALDLMSERVKIIQQMNKATKEAGGYQNLGSYFGYTKSNWFNDNRRLTEINERLKELSAARDQRIKDEQAAKEKAEQAAAARQKQRDEDKAAHEQKLADEKAGREQKRRDEKEARDKEVDEREKAREKENTDAWLKQLNRRILNEKDALTAARMDEVDRLNESFDQGLISAEQHEAGMTAIKQHYSQLRLEIIKKELEKQEEAQKGFWDRYYESMQESANNTDELWRQTFDNFSTGFGNAFASAVMQSESVGDAFKNMAQGMAQSMIAALGKIMAQRMVMWALEKNMLKGSAGSEVARVTSEAQSSALIAGINAFKSTAAIPIVGPTMAPGAMTAALAVTEPMAAAATAAATAGFAGAFDNGGYIPAGQWGVTGEYGPEITLGPSHIMGRKQTMSMLQQATSPEQGSANVSVEVHEAPPGTHVQREWSENDQQMVVRIMCRDANQSGEYYSYIASKLGVKAGGYK